MLCPRPGTLEHSWAPTRHGKCPIGIPACLAVRSGANASGSYWWQPPGVSPVPLWFLGTWPEDWFWGGAKTRSELGKGKQAEEQGPPSTPLQTGHGTALPPLIYPWFSTFLTL